MTDPPSFLYCCCQLGAEESVKRELTSDNRSARLSYSRPGFLTFKQTEPRSPHEVAQIRSIFARTISISLGSVTETDAQSAAAQGADLARGRRYDAVHVWQRDDRLPGDERFHPGPSPLSDTVGQHLVESLREADLIGPTTLLNRPARPEQQILDCVMVSPSEWWLGYHVGVTRAQRQPGGAFYVRLPPHAVSRAYLKVNEAIRWSGLPIAKGDRCVEIGSAPGGACQALLDRGLIVTGIDPAEMEPSVLDHPNFTHIRKRGADLKRREYTGFDWLLADSNVAPQHTLDTVEAIVTHERVNLRGLLLTLKMSDWKLAEQVPRYLETIAGWGYQYVQARQLAHNRMEVCVAAMRGRGSRRKRRAKGTTTSPTIPLTP